MGKRSTTSEPHILSLSTLDPKRLKILLEKKYYFSILHFNKINKIPKVRPKSSWFCFLFLY